MKTFEKNGYLVEFIDVKKNNDVQYKGVIFRKEDDNISPVIYVDDLMNAGYSDEEIVDLAYDRLCAVQDKPDISFDVHALSDWHIAKTYVRPKVLNFELNKERLKTLLWYPYMEGLVITFRLEFCQDENGLASAAVTKDLLHIWGVTQDDIYDTAMENFRKDESVCLPLIDMINQMSELPNGNFEDDMDIHILTNFSRINGATRILDNKFLKSFKEVMGKELVILPSSIHEVLIIPMEEGKYELERECLDEMVKYVNENEVMDTEILGDHSFIWREF